MITKNDIERLIAEKLNDTGWVEVPSAWYNANITVTSTPLKYRKIGNTVHFYGGLKTTVQRNAKAVYEVITLPAALNPIEPTRFIPQTNGNFDLCLALVESGVLKWCNVVQLNANGGMLFHLSYLTD